jgi:uncharacterized membrane protein YcgQ (UPF0703/DUF1980 family)
MEELVYNLIVKFPVLASILMVVGGLRIVVKPIMALLHNLADYSPSQKDDILIDKVENSKLYKGFLFCIDWLASIKVKK